MRDLARAGAGEMHAVGGAQFDVLAVYIGAEGAVLTVIVGEDVPDVDEGNAGAGRAGAINFVDLPHIGRKTLRLHHREPDPDERNVLFLEGSDHGVHPGRVNLAPARREGLDRLGAVFERLVVVAPEHHDGDIGFARAVGDPLRRLGPIVKISAHEAGAFLALVQHADLGNVLEGFFESVGEHIRRACRPSPPRRNRPRPPALRRGSRRRRRAGGVVAAGCGCGVFAVRVAGRQVSGRQ